jgi:hypothetical protein
VSASRVGCATARAARRVHPVGVRSALAFLLTACSAGPDVVPSLRIVSPVDEAVVCGSPLVVETEVAGITLVDPYTTDTASIEPGTGHVDVALNGQDVAMGGAERVEVPEVADGVYQLRAELSNADHTPVEPYAGDFVYVTVSAEACAR